jgi:hypothetical protein
MTDQPMKSIDELTLGLSAVIDEDPNGGPWIEVNDFVPPVEAIEREIVGMTDEEMIENFGPILAESLNDLIDLVRTQRLVARVRGAIDDPS